MRVIAGEARSLPLKVPEGFNTRPTTDRIKETLFNIIQRDIADSIFVDLFSGSGSIGIEAISRGAKKAYFIEYDKKAVACIRDNLNFTKFQDRAQVIAQDAVSGLYFIKEAADIIFMDPPYDTGLDLQVLSILSNHPSVREDTLIIVEASLQEDIREMEACGFRVMKEKKYKTNKHVFLYKKIEE